MIADFPNISEKLYFHIQVKGETDPLLTKLCPEKPLALQIYFWLFNDAFDN